MRAVVLSCSSPQETVQRRAAGLTLLIQADDLCSVSRCIPTTTPITNAAHLSERPQMCDIRSDNSREANCFDDWDQRKLAPACVLATLYPQKRKNKNEMAGSALRTPWVRMKDRSGGDGSEHKNRAMAPSPIGAGSWSTSTSLGTHLWSRVTCAPNLCGCRGEGSCEIITHT